MELVKLSDRGERLTVRPVATNEEADLIAWYQRDDNTVSSHSDHGQKLVQEAWENRYWFSCDCSKTDHPPLLFVKRMTRSGRFSLVRSRQHGIHHRECPFFIDEKSSIDTSTHTRSTGWLERIALDLVERAELNCLTPGQMESDIILSSQYASLRRAVTESDLFDMPMSRFFGTHYSCIGRIALELKDKKNHWPQNTEPFGLVMMAIDGVANNAIYISKHEKRSLNIHGRIYKSGFKSGQVKGPYLAVVQMGRLTLGTVRYEPIAAFYTPIYSKRYLVPVYSDGERSALKALISMQKWLLDRKKTGVDLVKVLPNIRESDAAPEFEVVPCDGGPKLYVKVTSESFEYNKISGDKRVVYYRYSTDTDYQKQVDSKFIKLLIAKILST